MNKTTPLEPELPNPIDVLRKAMDDSGVQGEMRAHLVGFFANHWNAAIAADRKREGDKSPVVRVEKIDEERTVTTYKLCTCGGANTPSAAPVSAGLSDAQARLLKAAATHMQNHGALDAAEAIRALSSRLPPDWVAVKKDAERYQWLRDPNTAVALVLDKQTGWVPPDDAVPGVGGYHTYEYRAGEELDTAIDAAIAAAPSLQPMPKQEG